MKSILVVCGNIGREPDLRFNNDGLAILKFSVAGESGYKDKKTTTWWNCVLFGKQAENMAKHLTKGSKVLVTGEPSVRAYTNKDGAEKWAAECVAKDVSFVGGKPAAQAEPEQAQTEAEDSSEIPF